jgi:hypothetical protein
MEKILIDDYVCVIPKDVWKQIEQYKIDNSYPALYDEKFVEFVELLVSIRNKYKRGDSMIVFSTMY